MHITKPLHRTSYQAMEAIRVVNPQVILSTPILDTLIDERSKFEHKLVEKTSANAPVNNILHSARKLQI